LAWQIVDLRTEGLEDPAHIGVLQRKADLDAEEAEADVPQPGKRLARLFDHSGAPDAITVIPALCRDPRCRVDGAGGSRFSPGRAVDPGTRPG
jgi:hypothetical protein